jgi:PBSX family phage portal protein
MSGTELDRTNQASADTNRRALRKIRVHVLEAKKQAEPINPKDDDEPGQSKELPEDPWELLTSEGQVIEPPFDLLTLAMLPERNSELTPCIEAMEHNIEGYGHRYVSRIDIEDDEVPEDIRKAVRSERVMLENFFQYASEESFTDLRKRRRKDLETTGVAFWEVIRSASGKVQGLNHIPSYQMRLGLQEAKPYKVDVPILELQEDGSFKVAKIPTWRRFRKFVQSRFVQRSNLSYVGGYQTRWFKEFGDPRTYCAKTGEQLKRKKLRESKEEDRANEIVCFKLYCPRSPYGLPRFIGNLLAILGDRAAEEINYITFRNNNVPSMMLLVSNGQITQDSIDRIRDYIETQIQGSDNYSKVLVVEAEGLVEGEEGGQVKMQIERLQSQQRSDALFQEYSKNNQDRIRRCFRLPPIFVGRSDDYTRATAEASRRLADEQIFAPEREAFDEWVNRKLFPAMGVVYHKFKSNSPNTTDNTELVKILANAEKTGALTPRIGRAIMADILSTELPRFPKDFPADLPFSMTMAEAVKNKADPAEPGQQVTALKLIKTLTGEMDEETGEVILHECEKCGHENIVSRLEADDLAVLGALVRLRARTEKQWREAAGLDDIHEEEDER